MARKSLNFDEKKFHQWLQQGRGQGQGASYRPWWQIGDFSSRGNRWRTASSLVGFRPHHLFSELEYIAYLHAWWDRTTTDIREHYVMLPLDLTRNIASLLKVRHPFNNKTKFPVPQQVDFLLTTRKGLVAWAVMDDKSWEKNAERTKFDIAKYFWAQRNVELELKLASSFQSTKTMLIDWIYDARRCEVEPAYQPGASPLHDLIVETVMRQPGVNSLAVAARAHQRLGALPDRAMPAIRRLLAEHVLDADLDAGSPQQGVRLYLGSVA